MTTKQKTWLKDNIMSIIIAAMFAAFFAQYQWDRSASIEIDNQQTSRISDLETISYNLGQSCIQWNEWQREHTREFNSFRELTQSEIMELWKMMPRGSSIKPKNQAK